MGLNSKYKTIVAIKNNPAKNNDGRHAFNITSNIKQRTTITLSFHPDTILFTCVDIKLKRSYLTKMAPRANGSKLLPYKANSVVPQCKIGLSKFIIFLIRCTYPIK